MALYTINYDLRNHRDYQKLYDELNNFEAVKILESHWCFNRINTSAASLRDHFSKFIDSDDGLFVSEVTSWASRSTDGTPKDLK
ncbi:CRISPR-associated protein Cas2 [Coraliomargarita sp. W4R72]